MTSQSWSQILLLVLRYLLWRFLKELVTTISKLKKKIEICLTTPVSITFNLIDFFFSFPATRSLLFLCFHVITEYWIVAVIIIVRVAKWVLVGVCT